MPRPPDPLAGLVDPQLFVPHRVAMEALARAQAEVAEHPVVLVGRAGTGKSVWLRQLGDRAAGTHRVVHCPFLHLPPADLEPWLLALLGGDRNPQGGETVVHRVRSHPRPTLLLVDEIQSAPPETVAALVELVREAGRSLELVLAGAPGPGLDRALARLPKDLVRLTLPDHLGRDEMLEELDAILEHPELPDELRARLARLDRQELVEASRGVPRHLRRLLEEVGLEVGGAQKLELRPLSRVRREPPPREEAVPAAAAPASALALPKRPPSHVVRPLRPPVSLRFPRLVWAVAMALVFASVSGAWVTRSLTGAGAWLAASGERMSALADVAAAPPVEEIRLNVNAVPWGEVSVDGRALGPTPLGVSMPPGRYRFEVRLVDGQILERHVDVGPGQNRVAFRGDPEPR